MEDNDIWAEGDDGYCLAEDARLLADRIVAWIRHAGAETELNTAQRLAAQIIAFVCARHRAEFMSIGNPGHRIMFPADWTVEEEEVWEEWLRWRFSLEGWRRIVMKPVFGTATHSWEDRIPGWRDELFLWLPFWVQRGRAIVRRFDPAGVLADAAAAAEAEEEAGDGRMDYFEQSGWQRTGRRVEY